MLPFFKRTMRETVTAALTNEELGTKIGMHTGEVRVVPSTIEVCPKGIRDEEGNVLSGNRI